MQIPNLKLRWIEFVLLYLVTPPVLMVILPPGGLIPALWAGGIIAAVVLWRTAEPTQVGSVSPRPSLGKAYLQIAVRFLIISALLTVTLWFHHDDWLFQFPRKNSRLWFLVMMAYPLLSVFPQAIVYRKFYERRYVPLFTSKTVSWWVGALVFSWAHIPFRNPVALVFTFFGGLMFLATYRKTNRLSCSIVEHALYGDFIFTVGWGIYLLHGTVALLQST